MNVSSAPCITVNVFVSTDLSVRVYRDGLRVNQSKLDWVLAPSGKLDCWSQLGLLLNHVQSGSANDKKFHDKENGIATLFSQLHNVYEVLHVMTMMMMVQLLGATFCVHTFYIRYSRCF